MNIENEYRSLMKGIAMPSELKSRIESAAIASRGCSNANPVGGVAPTAKPETPSPSRRRFVKLAAAAVAVVGAMGAGSALKAVLPQNPGSVNQATSTVGSGSFGLLAYAEEPDAEPGRIKDLEMDCFSATRDQRGGWNALESENGTAARGWTFDLTCVGSGIAAVTYTLGEGAVEESDLETGEFACFYEETQVFEEGERTGAESERLGSITIPYSHDANLSSSEEGIPSFHRAMNVGTHITEETLYYGKEYTRLFNELYYSDHDELDRLLTEYTVRETYEVALKLAETPLTVTAEFENGERQTKQYRIAPKDDYVERMTAQGVHFDDTGMYTIEEIA